MTEPTQELRISVVIPVPRDARAGAKAMVAADPLMVHIETEAKNLGGTMTYEVVVPKPRGGNGAQETRGDAAPPATPAPHVRAGHDAR